MPEPIAIFSSARITHAEFQQFLKDVGAALHPDSVYDGRISRGDSHIWILLDAGQQLQSFIEDSQDSSLERLDTLAKHLNGVPTSLIIVDVGREGFSRVLAVDFVYQCSLTWPCVLHDFRSRFYSKEEIATLYEQQQGFVWSE